MQRMLGILLRPDVPIKYEGMKVKKNDTLW
jgi:hypothetical protein